MKHGTNDKRMVVPFVSESSSLVTPCSYDDRGTGHLGTCRMVNCGECTFWRNYSRWKGRTLICNDESLGSWLWPVIRVDGDGQKWFAVGCNLCMSQKVTSSFGKATVGCPQIGETLGDFESRERSLMISRFLLHQKREHHLKALEAHGFGKGNIQAPTAAQFSEVLNGVRRGEAKSSMPGLCKAHKLRKMKWALAEGQRRLDLKWFRRAKFIAIFQDVRQARLLVRYKLITDKFEIRLGVLGCAWVPNASAHQLKTETMEIIQRACTLWAGVPGRPDKAPKPQVLKKIFKKFREAVQQFTSDSAADEQLCGQLLREKPTDPEALEGSCKQMYRIQLPNLKLVCRDRSHAAARILKRPWRASTRLWDAFNTFVWSKQSICSLLHNSLTFRHWFGAEVQRLTKNSSNVKNLGLARQRFGSAVKTGRRFILYIVAMNSVAGQIAATRKGKREGEIALNYLKTITEEDLLIIGCLMEISTECMKVVRKMDTEAYDPSQEPWLLDSFLHRVARMADSQHGRIWDFGLPKHILKLLSTGMVLSDGSMTRILGGSACQLDVVKARVIVYMEQWVVLAKLVVKAEFPAFETAFHYRVFDVHCSRLHELDHQEARRSLEALAGFYNVSVSQSISSYSALLGLAQSTSAAHPSWPSSACWVDYFKNRAKDTKSHVALRTLLLHYCCWCGVSSGVEQTFSLLEWRVTSRRQLAANGMVEDEIKLVADKTDCTDLLVEEARAAWHESGYGVPRKSPQVTRSDTGSRKRAKVLPQMSEAAFMRLREAEVEALMKDCGPDSAKLVESEDCEAKVLSVSEVSVLKEAKFNLVKRKRHLIQAVIDGIVDAKSCPTELLRDVAAELVARRKRRKDKAADERRRMLALRGKERFSVKEKQLLWATINCFVAELPPDLEKLRVAALSDASVLVVDDPNKMSSITKLRATLYGAHVVSKEFIAEDGANGWCIGFKPATRIRRWIFFTAAFERLHGEAVAMLKHAVALAHSRWKLDDDISRWRKLWLTAQKNKKSAEVVLLVSKREVQTCKCAKVTKQIWTLHSFSTMLVGKSIDAERTF